MFKVFVRSYDKTFPSYAIILVSTVELYFQKQTNI